MTTLNVFIEINGEQKKVGVLAGENYQNAFFTYSSEYLLSDFAKPISINLPLQNESFSPGETKIFFESLLPEGFSRKAVAEYVKVGEEDYLSILESLGRECIGAIQVAKGNRTTQGGYQPISEEELCNLAKEGATKSTELLVESHVSLAGASGKVGLYLEKSNRQWYRPDGIAASTHIVKQSHVRLEHIVLNEQLCMLTAAKLNIDVPNSFILDTGNKKEQDILFVSERFDRERKADAEPLCSPYRLHQEDFAQALGIPASEKYETKDRGYLTRMFELINAYSANPMEDGLKLWDRVVFNYLIGNTDAHIKNYGLLYDRALRRIRLAPAYDILCTRIYGKRNEMSIMVNGILDCTKVTRETFRETANELHLGQKVAMQHFDYFHDNLEATLQASVAELENQGFHNVKELGKRILNACLI